MRAWMTGCGLALLLAHSLRADDAPAKADSPPSVEVPYRLTDTQHVLVRVKLNGKGPFNFIIDTGAPAVILNEVIGKKLGLSPDKNGWADFDKFELEGGLVVGKTKGLVLDMFQLKGMNSMGLAGVELHGVIGYDLLARYRIRYDFTDDRLVFTPLKFTPPELMRIGGGKGSQGSLEMVGDMMKFMAPLLGLKPNFERKPRGYWGVEIDDKEGIVVTRVLPGSPAEKAGMKAGDRLTLVQKSDIDNRKDFDRATAKLAEGQKVKIKVKRGDEEMALELETGKGL